MGTNGNRIEATDFQIHPKGIDRKRSVWDKELGHYVAETGSSFRSGQWGRRITGDVVNVLTGVTQRPLGMFRADKVSMGTSVRVDDAVVVGANGTTTTLRRGSIVANSFSMRPAINMGAANIAENAVTTYALNTTNGIITWGDASGLPGGTIIGSTVYVTYTYNLVQADYDVDGQNYRITNDDVSKNANRVVVCSGRMQVFTTEYDTGVRYLITDALYVTASSQTSNASGGGAKHVGAVAQLPTSTDRYLGMDLHGDPVA